MRHPMVTRTIQATKAQVLCMNVETQESFVQEMIAPRTYKNEAKLLKKLVELNQEESVRLVHIIRAEVVEKLYGMTEAEFIAAARELPPRNVKKEN